MEIKIGDEKVVVRGIRPEEGMWGPYQFPMPYKVRDKIAVSVHVGEDSIKTYGDGRLWFVSEDKGETWQETTPDIIADCGLKLPNGLFKKSGGGDIPSAGRCDFAWRTCYPCV